MKYAFIRFETFPRMVSRKAMTNGKTPKRWTVTDVAGEAFRLPGHCDHVAKPRPPLYLAGSPEKFWHSIDNGLKSARGSGLRIDSHILLSVVTSWPTPLSEIQRGSSEAMAAVQWMNTVLSYISHWASSRKARLTASVFHGDEPYLHLHHLLIPTDGMRAKLLHPGNAAEERIRAAYRQGTLRSRLAAATQTAYTEAMQEELRNYWKICGQPFGHELRGPQPRRRVSRQHLKRQREIERRLNDDECYNFDMFE